MLLVQISDLHFGPMFRKEMWSKAVEEINALSPDAILVTGDITEDGFKSQFERAATELKRLKAGRMIFVSGNHDYRSTGYLLFRQCFPLTQITEFEDVVVLVLNSARPDRDDGEVGHRQTLWLERRLSRFKSKTRIVAIHHHVVPVPDTGADQITVVDAGDVLRSLVKSKVDLVLCGHRHRPWQWWIEDMMVIHAGSTSCEKLRGFFCNSYNTIKIEKGRVEPKLKIVDGDFVDFGEIVKRRAIFQASDLCQIKGDVE